jgi:hypothetical protein
MVAGLLFSANDGRAQILIWSAGNSQAATQNVATAIASLGGFSSVTAIDSLTVPLSTLMNYQEVLFFTNSNAGADQVAIGNELASFAATGRGLVLATFSWADQGSNTLAGGIITSGLSPFVFSGTTLYSSVTMASNDGSALFAGVTTLNGYYHDSVTLTPGSVLRGTWSDGFPLLATHGNVVGVNLFPDPSAGNLSGNFNQLFVNALNFASIPEPPVFLTLGAGLLLLFARHRRGIKRSF